MRTLAIESSGRHGSVAILEGGQDAGRLVGQIMLGAGGRTAQMLAPAIRDLLASADWPASSIELVAVTVGPGSFTGLRIGVTTAKTFAYAVGAQVVAVNTLAVLAWQVPPAAGPLWAILDAQRQELFVARFASDPPGPGQMVGPTSIVPQDEWLGQLAAGERVTGPTLRRLRERLPTGVVAVPDQFWQPTAAAVGRLGWRAYDEGQRDDLWKLAPVYYRPSAAEEKESRVKSQESRARNP